MPRLTPTQLRRAYVEASMLTGRSAGRLVLRAVRHFAPEGHNPPAGYDQRVYTGAPTGCDYEPLSKVSVPRGALLDVEIAERGEYGSILDWMGVTV